MKPIRALFLCVLLLSGAGCATDPRFAETQRLFARGDTEAGLELLEATMRDNPRNLELRAQWIRERELGITRLLNQAESARAQGAVAEAEAAYARVFRLDPNNARAKAGQDALRAGNRYAQQLRVAEGQFARKELEAAEATLRTVLAESPAFAEARALLRRVLEARAAQATAAPTLKAASREIDLEFRDANLRAVFEVISRTSGINFVFDRDVRPDTRTTITVRRSTIEDVIKLILVSNQLESKILNDNTLLIYPNTPAKQKEYQELVVRSFYLANADVKQTLAMIKTMVRTRDIFVDEKMGLLVMKDTPEAIRLAERLIAAQDLAEPEVILEVEILEIGSSRAQELGVRVPERIQLQDPTTVAIPGGPPVANVMRASGNLVAFVPTPAVIINLRQQDGITNVLANPRIRVKNREKAHVHIGDRVPVITTTASPNVGVTSSVAYLDVGLKLDVEPSIQLEGDVVMKVGLEVSNIVKEVPTTGGGLAYQVGTRNASTVLRLKDGETQVLAGLISEDERNIANRVPGLGNLPYIGRLFSSNNDTRSKTEIVLLITPRLVRLLARPDDVTGEYHAGTDANVGAPRLTIRPTGSIALSAPTAPALRQERTEGPPASEAGAPPSGALSPILTAAPQAAAGKTLEVTVQMPSDPAAATTDLELVYEPGALSAVSPFPDSGRIALRLSRNQPRQTVGFLVKGNAATSTRVRMENVLIRDAAGAVIPSSPAPAIRVGIAP